MAEITEITKRDIIELLLMGISGHDKVLLPLYGRLDEIEFLNRIFNLQNMPSYDSRFKDAEQDIWQHTINNNDWDDDWIFKDKRFNLMDDDVNFLKFLCKNFHPAVRNEKGEWKKFLSQINELLNADGYELYESGEISGRSIYSSRKTENSEVSFKSGKVIKCENNTYTIKGQYKQGSDAILFEVEDKDHNEYIMKVIVQKGNISKEKISRFINEMSFLYKQKHKNLVSVIYYGIFNNDTAMCYVMPKYISDLRTLINEGISKEKIIDYFWQICEGIKVAHEQNCWHRDLKPKNILYDKEKDILVVADFGIAHFEECDNVANVKTTKKDKLANFTYHAPEQTVGNCVESPTADIWALGLILNEMFTKQLAIGEGYCKISSVSRRYL